MIYGRALPKLPVALLFFSLRPQSVLDEMMVEQTDLVRLRMVRMSNVPDTLYMVNNAVPQCCHMISHQQMACNLPSVPSVVANEIPGEALRDQPSLRKKLLCHLRQQSSATAI